MAEQHLLEEKDLGNPASAGDSHPHDNRCWTKNKQHDNHGCNKQRASSTKVHNIWIQELLTTVFKVNINEKYKKQQKQLRCQIQCNLTTERLAPSWSVDGKLETLESQCWSSCQASTPLLPVKCDKFTLLSYSENLFKQNLMSNRVNVYFLCAQLALKAFERVEADRVLEASTQDRGSRCSPTLTYFCQWAVDRVIRPSTETRYCCDKAAAASWLREAGVGALSLSLVVISWSEAGLWASLTVSRLGQAEATAVQLRPHTGSLGQQTLANELKLPD